MKKLLVFLAVLLALASCGSSVPEEGTVKTTFQTSATYRGTIDPRADAVMIYGVGPEEPRDPFSLESRIEGWKTSGSELHFMTGIAWGQYADYFCGRWDGKEHFDEGQTDRQGEIIWHGQNVPYIVPTLNYLSYFKEKVIKRVIDNGIDHIFFEEPEFWAWAGYSEGFKREWKAFYGTDWQPQHESAEASYLSNKLKYHLYYRALEEACGYAKEYGRSLGRDIKCYVPTHSLVNYSQWSIVSPEASLASLPSVDGYIAQVWTGTSRAPEYYNGVLKERVFENAFLEYGCMRSMTAPTGRQLWFLTDPIEDGTRDWEDYRRNYHATFTAQLLYPEIADYEVMPWPERIYEGLYPVSKDSQEKCRMPADYATMMQVMIHALQDMPLSTNRVNGSQGIQVLMANSLMFQRECQFDGWADPNFSDFYGLAMPLLKRGIPVGITHIENTGYARTFEETEVLVMTYSNMKPLSPQAHDDIAAWVKEGGRLVYCGRDDDPFQSVPEWWNQEGMAYACPSDHLFAQLGLDAHPQTGVYPVGRGQVAVIRQDPKEFVLEKEGAAFYLDVVAQLYGRPLEVKNHFLLDRGPYRIAAVMDELEDTTALVLDGAYIDLYDPELPVCHGYVIEPGHQRLLYRLDASPVQPGHCAVLAAACRILDEKEVGHSFTFRAEGTDETQAVARIAVPAEPKTVLLDGDTLGFEYDQSSGTLLIRFPNAVKGHVVTIHL